MSVGYLEWPGVLFIRVWRASVCSPSRELCCLGGETGHRACTKNPFWYCHWHIQESRPNAEKLFPLKSCRLLLRLKCIFSHVVGVFHVVYCDDKKKKNAVLNMSWKTCLHRYTTKVAFLLLSLTEFIQLAINITTSCYMAKNIRRHDGYTSYIYCLNMGALPLSTSFMTKLGLKVVIIAKLIDSIKLKMCQFYCNAQIHTHIYLN